MRAEIEHAESRILKKLGIQMVLLILAGILASTLLFVFMDRTYTRDIPLSSLPVDSSEAESQLRASIDENPGVVALRECTVSGDVLHLAFQPVAPGSVIFSIGQLDDNAVTLSFKVTVGGMIVDEENCNYPHWKLDQAIIFLGLSAFCVMLWRAFNEARRIRRYSYVCVFCSGFAVWVGAIAVMILVIMHVRNSVYAVMNILMASGYQFMVMTLPFCIVFAAGLCASNVSLIKHEGKSKVNRLGFILSAVILLGQAAAVVLYNLGFSGSEMELRIRGSVFSVETSLYILLECFLIGAIICGILAVRSKPSYDADYVIILGCAIRKDGTMYPLLRGRVDRAVAFVREQKKATGRDAIFVPSGGQGRNEVISEAEAMTRYLLEQGIPREQIRPENRSANTAQNMRFSREIIEAEKPDAKVVFSTTNYHVFRSGIISRQAGFAPEGIGAPTKWYYWPNAAVRELIGMLVYLRRILLALFLLLMVLFTALNMLLPM